MDDTVCGGGIVQTSQGMCSLARVSTALGVKHLIAQSGLTFTSTCWLGLIYLVLLRWSRCTPGLRTGNL
jgi:hypothetical protein